MKRKGLRCASLCIALAMLCGVLPTALAEDKKETVYVIADASGNTESISVSERLYNPDKLDKIEDASALKNIENVGGDQVYTMEDGVLTDEPIHL